MAGARVHGPMPGDAGGEHGRSGWATGCSRGSCLDARGIEEEGLAEGVRRASLDELTDWTLWADKVLTV